MRGRMRQSLRAGAATLTLLAATVAGCGEQSRVAPDATITISGLLTGPDGAPAPKRPVRLGTGISDGDGALAVLTIGLSCTTGACTGNLRDATTDDAGRFIFSLVGRDTQSSFGEAVSVLVSATGSPEPDQVSGPLTSARFQVQTEALELPTLPLVDPDLVLEGGSQVVARWTANRAGPYDLTFEAGEEVPVWLARTTEPTVDVDPRLLEDTAGRVVVGARYEEAVEGSPVEMRWRSPGVPYAAGAGAPPSRGRPCRYVDVGGVPSGEPALCDLTDGDLHSEAAPPVCPASAATCTPAAAIVELGAPVPAELVVVRGCDGGCGVEVSSDGTTFHPVGAAADGFGTVSLDGTLVTAVKVGLGSGLTRLREVSVWGPAPAPALVALDAAGRDALAEPYGGRVDDDRRPSMLLVALAAAGVGGVLVGIGVALGRRRAPVDR